MNKEYEFVHNVFLDSCVFNLGNTAEADACSQIFKWAEESIIVPILAHSVLDELNHPNTPRWMKELAMQFVSTREMSLTLDQQKQLKKIESIIIGQGKYETYCNDALHVFISDDSGKYFITADDRLLKKREEIKLTSTGIVICKPTELVEIVNTDR